MPEVVNKPREKTSEYFPLVMAGSRMPPRAMMVSPVAPVRAVKTAQVNKAITDRPPGIQPKTAFDSRMSRFGAPLSESR